MAASEFMGKLTGGITGGSLAQTIGALLLGTVVLSIFGFGLWWWLKRKMHWNLKVEFRLPRNIQKVKDENGKDKVIGTIRKEWGKGYYNAKQGVVYVKRPKKKPVPMKPFNIKESLSDNNVLTVIQVGIEDYRPVIEDSYLEAKDYLTGDEGALINARIDTSESRAWRNQYERERKATYTIKGFLQEHGQLLGFGFILFVQLIGFAIVISKIPT